MGDVFQSGSKGAGRPATPEPVNVVGSGAGKPGGAGVYRELTPAAVLYGRKPIGPDPRKFNYDVVRGRAAGLGFSVSKDDRMSASEAGAMLHRLHTIFGLDKEVEGVLCSFDKALFFMHTLNSASVLTPGRSEFAVEGGMKISYATVREVLGNDMRRFFRAFADEIADVNRQVISAFDPYDVEKAEQFNWLTQVAYERGMQRHPHLSHDSADACSNLTAVERLALSNSKTLVIGSSNNSADKLKATGRVQAGPYDVEIGN